MLPGKRYRVFIISFAIIAGGGILPCLAVNLSELEKACYTVEPFQGSTALVPRSAHQQVALLSQLVKEGKQVSQAYLKLSQAYLSLGREDYAHQALEYYLKVEKRSPESLRKMADFLGARLKIKEQLSILEELASKSPAVDIEGSGRQAAGAEEKFEEEDPGKNLLPGGGGAVSVYQEIIRVARRHGYRETIDRAYQALVGLFPKNPVYQEQYLQELLNQNRYQDALKQLDHLGEGFPERVAAICQKKAEIFLKLKKPEAALGAYRKLLSDLWEQSLYFGYFDLLQRLGQFSAYRKALLQQSEPDGEHLAALFFLWQYSGQPGKALKTLQDWLQVNQVRVLQPEFLRKLARLLLSAGYTREASQALYSCWLSQPTEERLLDLFWLVARASGRLPFGRETLSTCLVAENFDTAPGFLSGILSLWLNDTGLRAKLKELEEVNISYSNATLVYHLFLEFSRQFPASPSLPRLHEEMMAVAFRYGNYQQVIAWGEKYLARYPAGETALSVLHRMAEAYYLQKKFAQAWATYERLLQAAATQPTLKKFYLAYLESYLAKLVEQKEYLQVMAVYWEQIRQHPEDEKLYEHFLNFINAHNLYQEELKLYQVALRQFPGANWYHRLARWYLVRKGRAAFQEKTRELRQVMKEPELESYFKNFSDSWDGEDFPLEMARYAHEKFPTSPFFARFLFDLVFSRWGWGRRSDFQPQMLQVAAECFWLDETIRHRFYQYLSWKKKLPEEVRQAGALPGGTYLLFRAEGAAWLSHYELAYSLFTRLAGLYSGEEWIQKKTAELARSLGLRKEASALYLSLAERHPAEKEYWTRAGEVLAEAGQYEAASQCWEKLPKTGPYDPGSYLELATLYWDYYQFEKALATIKKARLLFQDEFLMAREMGILYEGLKEYSPAVAEYVKTCLQQPGGNSTVIKRLVYLSRVRNLGPLIENTFRQWLTPERPGTVFAFGSYLAACGQTDAQKKLYAETFRQFREKAVLERFYRFFEEQGERQLMAEVLKHMVTAGGEDRASLSRLAAFYENQGDQVSAEAVYQKMLAHFKNEEEYLSVLLEVKNYYWRRKDVDKALSYLKEAVSRSSGPERERLSLELANQLMDARRLSEAGQVVRDLLKERPLETSLIDALARIYERENDWAQLRQLVAESIRQIQYSQLSSGEKQNRIIALRRAVINIYSRHHLVREALDQYIEILNRKPLEKEIINEIYTFAREHGLIPLLKSYYQKTAETAFRDYRWSAVLAELAIREGNPEEAKKWWQAALKQEPHRSQLWESLAASGWQSGDWETVAEAYRRIWRLEHSTRALLQLLKLNLRLNRQEERDAIIQQLLVEKNVPLERYLKIAALLSEEGLDRQAWEMVDRALDLVLKAPYQHVLSSEDAEVLGRVAAFSDRETLFLDRVQALLAVFEKEKVREQNFERWKIERSEEVLRQALGSLAAALDEFGQPARKARVASWVRKQAQQSSFFFDGLLSLSRAAHLPDVERDLLLLRLNQAAGHRREQWLQELLQFYLQRQNFAAACLLLKEERDKPWMSPEQRSYYQQKLARLCLYLSSDQQRLQPARQEELNELAVCYRQRQGVLTEKHFSGAISPEEIQRFLNLTWRYQERCQPLVDQVNGYVPVLLQFLLEKGERTRVLQTIDGACRPLRPVWRDTKKILVSQFFRRPLEEFVPLAERVLRLVPVRRQLHQPVDRETELIGGDWFVFARRYGQEMMLACSAKAGDYLVAELEGWPLSGAKQVALADWYRNQKKYQLALSHYHLAGQLNYDPVELQANLGLTYLAIGKKETALAEWKKIVDQGSPKAEDYIRCFTLLYEHGLAGEAWRILDRAFWGQPALVRDNVTARRLLSAVASRVRIDDPDWVKLLKRIVQENPEKLYLCDLILKSGWVKPDQQENFYRQALAVLSTRADLPAFQYQLTEWQQRLVTFYLENRLYEPAFSFLQGCLKSQTAGQPEWIQPKLLQVLIMSGRWDQARNLETTYLKDHPEEAVVVADWWAKVNQPDQRRRVLKTMYQSYVNDPELRQDAYLVGLAGILFEEDQQEQAEKILKMLVYSPAAGKNQYELAAETAQRYGRLNLALAFREKLALLYPGEAANHLERARLLLALKRQEDAVSLLARLVLEENRPDKIRLAAADLLARVVVTLPREKQEGILRKLNAGEEKLYPSLAYGCYLFRSGAVDNCFRYLEKKGSLFPDNSDLFTVKGRLAEESGQTDLAIESWRRVLYREPENTLARLRLFYLLVNRAGKTSSPEHQYYQALHVAAPFLPPGFPFYPPGDDSSGENSVSEDYLARLEKLPIPTGEKLDFLQTLGEVMVEVGCFARAAEAEAYLQRMAPANLMEASRKRQQQYRLMAKLEKERKGRVLKLTGDLTNGGTW